MRWLLSILFLGLLGLVQALSSSGNRLLVVIEDAAEKDKYSQFWADLEGLLEPLKRIIKFMRTDVQLHGSPGL